MNGQASTDRRALWPAAPLTRGQVSPAGNFVVQLAVVFLAYLIAGMLGQATTNLRSGNIGPVWPAYGFALAGVLAYGPRIWPAITASAFLVALQSPVYVFAALGQAASATVAVVTGAAILRRIPGFTPSLERLRDAIAFVAFGAFGSALISATFGLASLYLAGAAGYSSLPSAWLIYWLGDATGALLITPLVFTTPRLLRAASRRRAIGLAVVLSLVAGFCVVVYTPLVFDGAQTRNVSLAVLPLVMWAAIEFGVGGAALAVFIVSAFATLATAMGVGPFAGTTPFVGAVRLDVVFSVLALTGLSLAAVIAEREAAQAEHERLIRAQAARETQRADDAVSNLGRRLLDAQEQERRRIARELHDDIGQRLAALAINLDGHAALQRQAAEIASDVQALSHQLHSSRIELLGLTVAMRHFCAEFAMQQKLAVDFHSRDLPEHLPPDVSHCLFRILQESLHNAAKHSGGRDFVVRLLGQDAAVHLEVVDRGKGFDVARGRAGRGIGLVSMEERLKLVDGELWIESILDRGTAVRARVPVTA
jgi:signal transduction histidine kinase